MERLYASGCGRYTSSAREQCLAMTRVGSFATSQLFCLLFITCSLLHRYVFTSSRLNTLYGPKYSTLPPQDKGHLRLVHVGIVMKFVAVPTMIIPLCIVNLGGYTWSASLKPGFTLLDLTSLSGCSLAASALFDLVFDDGIRPLYISHHLAMLIATHGTTALIMTLPTDNKLRVLGMFQAYKVGLTWGRPPSMNFPSLTADLAKVLFSSLGSTVSRLTYVFRKLFTCEPETLRRLFQINFVTFSSVTVLEAVTVAYLLLTRWERLPTDVAVIMSLFQVLFTMTKWKTVGKLFGVYKSHKTEIKRLCRVRKWEEEKLRR
ncbi:hypothetical protein BDV11DRAFT_212952 [Aspergillus similis]